MIRLIILLFFLNFIIAQSDFDNNDDMMLNALNNSTNNGTNNSTVIVYQQDKLFITGMILGVCIPVIAIFTMAFIWACSVREVRLSRPL